MTLVSGIRLGRYEIVAPIGTGGMGEVYRARDTRLGRSVAIKILPSDLAADAKFRSRFEREARAASSLNHPHICTLYDVGRENGFDYLVMELCEGRPLSERLEEGPLSVDEVLEYGSQIADALHNAHRNGVVHRDLKPSNVMLTAGGAKVVDFGLAKPRDVTASVGTTTITEDGTITGTIQYLAPEVLNGEVADERSDIFALGLILYEMSTGKRAFDGPSKASVIAAIMEREPQPLRELRPALPVALDDVIKGCLAKSPARRLQSAHDIAVQLRVIRVTPGRRWRPRKVAAAAISSLAVVAVIAWVVTVALKRTASQEPTASKFTFTPLTDDSDVETAPSLSPDGNFVAYVSARNGNDDIYLQRIGARVSQNLTEASPANDSQPAFSRDGRRIAFRSDRDGAGIFTMGVTGESVRRVTNFGSHPSWSPDGREIVVSSDYFAKVRDRRINEGELSIVTVATGQKRQLTTKKTHGDAVQPAWSPHGHRIAFWQRDKAGPPRILTISARGGEAIVAADPGVTPVWSPDGKYLYFVRGAGAVNLWRVRIDEETGRPLGNAEPFTVPARHAAFVSFSADGRTLAYPSRESRTHIEQVSLGPGGIVEKPPTIGFTRTSIMEAPDVSPDGEWLTFMASPGPAHVARVDGRDLRQVTDDETPATFPIWSPDGKRIGFQMNRGGKFEAWAVSSDGSNLTQLTRLAGPVLYPKWSPDGTRFTVRADEACESGTCLLTDNGQYPITKAESLPLYEPGSDWRVVIHGWSPDGKWLTGAAWRVGQPSRLIVYSVESKTYVTLLESTRKIEGLARWLPDSRHLLFTDGRRIHVIDRETRQHRVILDAGPGVDPFFTVSKDGRHLYFARNADEGDIWIGTMK